MKYLNTYLAFIFVLILMCNLPARAQQRTANNTVDNPYNLRYPFSDEPAFPYDLPQQDTGLKLRRPANIKSMETYHPETNTYIVEDKIGNTDYRPPREYTVDEYSDLRFQRALRRYWSDKSREKGTVSRSFMPRLNIGGEAFNKIFGSNTVNIEPQGSAELIFSINTNRIENPALQERLRSTTTFDFQEKIQMNVQGSIGDKVKIGITYDTEATFDFENKTNIGYTGEEDEIIQKIEAGNVTLPLTGSLITGSQNLFGLKTDLKFGHLTVTNVFSQQKGKTKTIEVEGGAEKHTFEIPIDEYDANRHFFLGHFFRNNYEKSLQKLPVMSSSVRITKLEVWITNKNSNYETSRNIVAIMNLGEENGYTGIVNPSNSTNWIYASIKDKVRNINNIVNILEGAPYNLESGKDYEFIENARRLNPNEYTFNATLGYISLNYALNSDEVLGVAYEYEYNGKIYKVGELSSDLSNATNNLIVKLIKNKNLSPRYPSWPLMMKNVYAIGAYQMGQEDFEMLIFYQNDETGTPIPYIPDGACSHKLLLQVLHLDRLNTQLDAVPDGIFDFVEGVTVIPSNGRIIFPVLEPFGSHLAKQINPTNSPDYQDAVQKYVYRELYDSTRVRAKQIANKNKFIIKGSYKSSSGADISLNAMNVPKGSVVVTAGGIMLKENVDYTVDYTLGRVKILNQGLLESGTPIQISLESNALYNLQTKTLVGTHLDYKFSENLMLGGTILNLTERPLTKKVNYGDEPIFNTIWGLNGSYSTKSQFLTKIVDRIPLINTKEQSSVSVDAEFAHLIPGHSRALDKAGVAYIDDFESSENSIDIKSFPSWVIASTPQRFPEAKLNNDLRYGYNRAKLAWYVIDPLFLRNISQTPAHIKETPDLQSSHFVREVYENDIFKKRETQPGVPTNMPVLNLAFYPNQRGPYNYDIHVDEKGFLLNRKNRWGGIMREIPTSNFEAANIEFIDFWLMDPFIEFSENNKGGKLIFNLGNISEDILRDSRKMFENGLPNFENTTDVEYTVWGRIPKAQSISNAFNNDVNARLYQDVGLDGLDDERERSFFKSFLDSIRIMQGEEAYRSIFSDPSSDNFSYYRSSAYDDMQADILRRYKDFNGMEGNSPASEQTRESYSTSGSTLPDVEDINNDNTLDRDEAYYEYEIDLSKSALMVGKGFITDMVEDEAEFPNGIRSTVNWYHFRIPIRNFSHTVGSISDFTSIRFLRMYLTGFEDSVFLRFATLELVRGEWRKYYLPLGSPTEALTIPEAASATFDIGAVNIEENASKSPVNYILPPGIDRVIDPSSPQIRQLNEQAISLKVMNLEDGDARAAYKTMNLDIREYKRLRMFMHAEAIEGCPLQDYELSAFIRIGSDFTDNYYEYEVPLKLTPPGSYINENDDHRRVVWPEENEFDIDLEIFKELKLERNRLIEERSAIAMSTIYTIVRNGRKISIRGNPNLRDLQVVMIGVRNPIDAQGRGASLCAEVWMNELRLTDFREKGGWAANARLSTQLADFASISIAGGTSKPGFGSIEKKNNERSKEEMNRYDISSNIHLGKIFPEKAQVRIPMYVGYSETFVTPEYSPLDPDIPFKEALDNIERKGRRDTIRRMSRDYTRRKSLNFTNVGIGRSEGTPKIYHPSNITLDYGYSEIYMTDINVEYDKEKQYTGGLNYNFSTRPKEIMPFKKGLNKPAYRFIKDFNFSYQPSMIAFRTSMNRRYQERKTRNIYELYGVDFVIPPTVNKDFFWNREYMFKYDLTRALKIDFSAVNTALIDEPMGIVNKDSSDYQHRMDSIYSNIRRGGRTSQYTHRLNVTYTVPINKITMFNWVSVNTNYSSDYRWEAGPMMNFYRYGIEQYKTPYGDNRIGNSNTSSLNTSLSMTSLYNKSPVLKKINQMYRTGKRQSSAKPKKITVEKTNIKLKAGKSKIINHRMNSDKVKVWATTAAGKEIEGEVKILNKDKVQFTPKRDYDNVIIKVEGDAVERPAPLILFAERSALFLMGVKNISISYSESRGTDLPGYRPTTKYMGMNEFTPDAQHPVQTGAKTMWAPGLPFILGMQDYHFADFAYRMQWLTVDTINDPVVYSYGDRLHVRSTVEPLPGLKIELTGNRNFTKNRSLSYFPIFISRDSVLTTIEGNFGMSIISARTAFEKIDIKNNFNSKTFENFKKNIPIIAERMAAEYEQKYPSYRRGASPLGDSIHEIDSTYPYGFGPNSPHVLIPALLAAYAGSDARKISLNPMPSFLSVLPNWQIRYSNLVKIAYLAKYFRTINLNHTYTSQYSIGSYINNRGYDEYNNPFISNLDGNFILQYDYSGVTISEQFRPLIGIDMTLKNNLMGRFEIKKMRNVSLSFSNNRLTEIQNNEIVIGSGYRFDKLPLTINNQRGEQRKMEGDLNLTGDVSFRDDKTILRDLAGNSPDQPSSGKNIISIKVSADYALSNKFNVRLFYDRIVNNPLISRSFPTRNTNIGFSVRFTLTP